MRLGTGVLLAALRRPAVLAKSAATLDVLSGGRLDLGVGIGWQREEYEAAGLDFGAAGPAARPHARRVPAAVAGQRGRLRPPTSSAFDGIHMMPKPVAPGGVPIWVSGTLNQRSSPVSPASVPGGSRGARRWATWRTSIPRMRDGVAALGRDPAGIGVVGSVVVMPDEHGAVDADRRDGRSARSSSRWA